MKRLPRLLFVFILLITIGWQASSATAQSATSYRSGELLIKLHPDIELSARARPTGLTALSNTASNNLARTLQRLGAYHAESLGEGSNTYLLRLRSSSDAERLASQLTADPAVAFAEPNYVRHLMRTPNDPIVEQQWALNNIQAYQAWDITTGGEIVIAVLDTGVDGGHPDLQGKVLPGFNAFTNDGNSNDDQGHGTAVAGLIAANTDNSTGIAGICWSCKILPVKVLSARGSGNDASVSRGIRWAADNGARVINMSLGGSEESQTLREAVYYALGRGVLVIAASGNERQEGNAINYPAGYPEVVAVGATGNTDIVTGFSNTGDHVDITAPGVGMWTLLPSGQYGVPNGTSFSSPYVAGVAGLVLSLRGDLGFADAACVLEASTDDKGAPGKDQEYGWGRLNALKAVQLAQSYTGCPLNQPAPAQPQPDTAAGIPPAFTPVAGFPSTAEQLYFPETQHSLRGEFKNFWERHGGLPIFGFPISEEFVERSEDGTDRVVQYFERYRLEFHPDKAPPYNVQLSRMGDTILRVQGRDWFTFPKTGATPGCLFFDVTGNAICEPFLSFWRSSGLEFDGQRGKSYAESLALFGQPISPPQTEEIAPGVFVTVQWFERARLEDHGSNGVLLGLLSSDFTRYRGWR